MRDAFYVQTAWSHYFKKRMDREMKHYAQTENAFQKMRACAGNSDVKEMVMKFLTREQTYTQLLQSVSDNERKYEILKQENEEKRHNLQKILLQNDNRKVGEVDPVKEERQQSYALPKHAEDDPDVVKYN